MPESSNVHSDDLSFSDVVSVIWRYKIFIIITTLISTALSVVIAYSLPNKYTASVLLAPASSAISKSSVGLSGQLGGLASLAGLNMKDNGISNAALALEIVKSRDFISRFIEKHSLLVPLFASEKWLADEDKLLLDETVYSNGKWIREVNPPRDPEPSAQEAYEEFMKLFSIVKDNDRGIVTFLVEHHSPNLARQWADNIVKDLNSYMKQKDMQEAKDSLMYLKTELSNTEIEELRNALYQLIEEQTKTLMLAQVNKEYVYKVIDPAVAPEKKSKPNRPLICVLGFLSGVFISCFISFLMFFSKKR